MRNREVKWFWRAIQPFDSVICRIEVSLAVRAKIKCSSDVDDAAGFRQLSDGPVEGDGKASRVVLKDRKVFGGADGDLSVKAKDRASGIGDVGSLASLSDRRDDGVRPGRA